MWESGVLNFIILWWQQNDAATLTLLECDTLKFNAAYESLAWAFISHFGQSCLLDKMVYFYYRAIHDELEGVFVFIKLFNHERVDAESKLA